MDNVLFYCYLAFMILIPTLSALGGSGHGDSLIPLSPLQHGPRPLLDHLWRRLRWVPVAGESGYIGYYNVATYVWRCEFCGLAYEASDVVPNLTSLLNTRRHGTVWVDPDHPSRILPSSWRGRLLICLVFGAIPVCALLRSRELL